MASKKSAASKTQSSSSNAPPNMSHFSVESMKMIGESIGVSALSDEASRLIADDVLYRLKLIIQESEKFAGHAKRRKVIAKDIDDALKVKNIEPLYGIKNEEHIPFRFASGGGRELYFIEEKEIDLGEVITSTAFPKLPQDVALKSHWLSIEGIQPAIPENPPPVEKELQRKESVDPAFTLRNNAVDSSKIGLMQDKRKKHVEMVRVKQYATHELSVEQQLYYKEITEACVGSDETRRSEALQSLTADSGLHQMLPRLCTFISEGVKVNVVQNNLALLIYLMRMVKALLENQTLYLEKYLHEIIPTVITCIVSKQLCMRPDIDNHWALRDFASRLLSQVCKNFNTSTNNVQTRITRLLSRALDNDKLPLSSQYGALSALCELGPEVQRAFVYKRLPAIGEKIRQVIEGGGNSVEKSAADHIKNLILRVIPPTLKASIFPTLRSPPDVLEEYKTEFGYLGPSLHAAVVRSRNVSTPIIPQIGGQQLSSSTVNYIGTGQSSNLRQPITLASGSRLQMPTSLNSSQVFNPPRRPNPTVIPQSNQQRFVILNNSPRQITNQGQFIKLLPGSSISSSTTQGQKYVVMHASSHQQQKVDEVMIIETPK
ncbi:transcription initiation factor tfii-D-like protein [Dinothrombium tinctorium]|uniref:Transcription initiation factor TFIID subunit 6 n=1 Tax=Dinothrombium tinctorium TaxID=1965070 RepID=A0A3S3NMC3_9ACAR|nr:transcription initiation factor tfii-D-like protein [Dinothrombium tinctorium]RWS06091.1 transcription initiation factor tfii-D-like protein [Dinothrombium tinctorium]